MSERKVATDGTSWSIAMTGSNDIGSRWRRAQDPAIAGALEYKTMARSLLSLARQVDGAYMVTCATDSGVQKPLSKEMPQERLGIHQQRQTARFLERARADGHTWATIQDFLNDSDGEAARTLKRNYLKLIAWYSFKGPLLEALCLLAALSRFTAAGPRRQLDVFGQSGPLPVRSGARDLFLWTRPTLPATKSGLRAKPDLLCTSDRDLSNLKTIEWILESKCRGLLNSHDLRAEFGKAFDLETPSYTVVVFKKPLAKIVRAAGVFGLDIRVFPLISDKRQEYLDGRRDLGEDVADMLKASREKKMFGHKVLAKGGLLEKKMSEE